MLDNYSKGIDTLSSKYADDFTWCIWADNNEVLNVPLTPNIPHCALVSDPSPPFFAAPIWSKGLSEYRVDIAQGNKFQILC